MPSSGQIYPPDLLDLIETHDIGEWGGTVWRHMFADLPPSQVNVKGARWNPSSVGAIYTSLSRETALAEAEYMIAMQPRRPRAERKLYTLQVTVEKVVDLTDLTDLAALGVSAETLGGIKESAATGEVLLIEKEIPEVCALKKGINFAKILRRCGMKFDSHPACQSLHLLLLF